jgi:hypothetical protein
LASYRAPPGCPDAQAYVSSVESRSQTLRLRSERGQAHVADRLRVRIQADAGSAGWRGQLQIEGTRALEREVHGERCEDVALALALIAVLRLDAKATPPAAAPPAAAAAASPRASTGPASGAAAAPTSGAAPAADATAVTPPGEPTPAARGAPPALSREPAGDVLLPDRAVEIVRSTGPRRLVSGAAEAAPERDEATATREAASSQWQPGIAAHVGYVSAPGHALQARLRGELQLGPRPQSGSVALGFGYASAGDRNASADLDFALLSAQLHVCPLALGAEVWLRACAVLSGGVFSVSARALDDDLVSQSSARAWAALGPGLEVGIPLGSGWSARALAEASFLLVRDSFEVERIVGDEAGQPSQITRTLLYRPPVGAFAASLGLGYAF